MRTQMRTQRRGSSGSLSAFMSAPMSALMSAGMSALMSTVIAAVSLAQLPRQIAVSNEGSRDVTLLDAATGRTVATIPLGARARGIHVSADNRTIYVALSDY